ncbi:MAG: hypothetical protein E5Y73_09730 [Mesorhizobium sp.]|uniref:hypothetical protein n=1 Tax=Mesorhizobium sp. TaxID=1871066 RepID=UPI00121C93C7|nr:hypothetical protein [Mesorhizobium sp.]TIL94804.1 MAG: hypothetical protein E5Y73_09730 [Mesorhizobium sp.]
MTTRILHLNNDAAAPVGLISSARFRLVPPGGIRLNADNVTIASGMIDEFVNMIGGQLYGATSNQNCATVEAVNGVNVATFDKTLVVAPTGYTMGTFGFGGLNTGQYTFAALWKVTDGFLPAKPREIIAQASLATTSNRAMLREDASGALQARALRTTAGTVTIVSIPDPVRVDGWCAAAAVFDWTNDLVTIHDLLGTESVSAAILGTSGAAPSDISAYRLGYYTNTEDSWFNGKLADYHHLPYVPTASDLLALRLHMQARAADLAA